MWIEMDWGRWPLPVHLCAQANEKHALGRDIWLGISQDMLK